MYIDVSNIKNSKDAQLKIEESDNLEFFNAHLGELEFKEPVFLKGTIFNIGDEFLLKGCIKTVVQLNCCCCNKPVDRKINLLIEEVFSNDDAQNEVWVFNGNIIELNPVIISNIALDIPMKVLCKEDCKGLCPKCGHDLNESDCNCDMTELDSRFEVLNQLVFDEEV